MAGTLDVPLTDLGVQQALQARTQVAAHAFARALTSDLERARRTAEILLAGRPVPLLASDQLRERSCGSWERRFIDELETAGDMDRAFRSWRGCPPGGESLEQVALRASAWLATVDGEHDTLVVAHGALMRALLGALDQRPHDRIDEWRPTNCEIAVRTLEIGGWARLHRALAAALP